MREILFRGKRIDNGEFTEGFFFKEYSTFYRKFSYTIQYQNKFGMPIANYEIDPETVGQFTGLTDKNGKKIFEGDIVAQNWYVHDEPSDDSVGEVVFCEQDCSFSVMETNKDGIVPLGRCHAYHWEAEVIGNIHDNPELLENSQ